MVPSAWSALNIDFRADELQLGTDSQKTKQPQWKETPAMDSKAMD